MRNNVKKMVFSSLMTALCVIIAWVCKSYFTFGAIRITFENLPVLLSGILLGPAAGAVVGAAADIISALLTGFSINPIITFGAAAIGASAGLFSHYIIKGRKFGSLLPVSVLSHLIGSVLIKSFGLWLHGYPFEMLAIRLPLYLCIAAVESYFLYIVLKNRRFSSGFENRGAKK